jgi:tRNA nucleotidyltransferase (CCA-adding enzyme)
MADRFPLDRLPAAVAGALAGAAAEGPLHVVGGAVRDVLLGRDGLTDIDVAVEGDAVAVARHIARALAPGARVTAHAAFGTAVVRAQGLRVDVATTRSETYPRPGALPVVAPAGIEADLRRRDFTVNAMAVSVPDGRLLDPTGGRADLADRSVRVLHVRSFEDDPTRTLRAARYAARLGFAVEPGTATLARVCARSGAIADLSGARLRAELVLLLGEESAPAAVGLLHDLGLDAAVHPDLSGGADTRALLAAAESVRATAAPRTPRWRVALGVLARDLPPPALAAFLRRLALRRSDAAAVAAAAHPPLPPADAPADAIASAYAPLPAEAALAAAAAGSQAAAVYLDRLRGVRLAIDGDVLREELGLAESPRVGEVLRELLRRKRNGELRSRAAELEAARELVAGAG